MDDLGFRRGDWLLLSVALATLASLLHWRVLHRAKNTQDKTAVFLARLIENPWFIQPLRLCYAIGIPAALLFWQHALTARGLGLQPFPDFSPSFDIPSWAAGQWIDWLRDLGWGAAVASITGLLVLFGNYVASKNTPVRLDHRHDLGISLREGVYHQAHWAFYREPFVIAYGFPLGCWLGALPVIVEALLNPICWESIQSKDITYARHVVVRSGIYVATNMVFLKAQNLWIALLVDVLLAWLLLPAPFTAPENTRSGQTLSLLAEQS